jgi:hypothetical protein
MHLRVGEERGERALVLCFSGNTETPCHALSHEAAMRLARVLFDFVDARWGLKGRNPPPQLNDIRVTSKRVPFLDKIGAFDFRLSQRYDLDKNVRVLISAARPTANVTIRFLDGGEVQYNPLYRIEVETLSTLIPQVLGSVSASPE